MLCAWMRGGSPRLLCSKLKCYASYAKVQKVLCPGLEPNTPYTGGLCNDRAVKTRYQSGAPAEHCSVAHK
jgi:hypothetical protein